MEDKLVCGWDEFETHAANTIKQLWNDKELTDVTLATMDDQQINAHRFILSSSSNFFKLILSKNSRKNLVIYLKDIQYNDLKIMLEFIYFGECKVRHADLGNFIETGNSLKVKGLVDNVIETNNTDVNSEVLNEELIHDNQTLERFSEREEKIANVETGNEIRNEQNNDISISKPLEIENGDEKSFTNFEPSPSITQPHEEITPTKQNKKNRLDQLNKDKTHHILGQFFREGFFRCDECPVSYEEIEDFTKHKRTVHDGIIYSCNQCKYKSKRFQEGLAPHMLKHGAGSWYNCDQCEFKAAQAKYIKNHRMVMHGSANYGCDQCNYRSTREFNLHHHMKAKHEGVRYECDQCDHRATLPNNLFKHKLRYHRKHSVTINTDSK